MLYLNNRLLTSEGIISFFEQAVVNEKPAEPLAFTLYRMKVLPENLKGYKNSYLVMDDKLFYVTPEGVLDQLELALPESLIAHLSSLVTKIKSIKLTTNWLGDIQALNPGHQAASLLPPPSALIQLKNKLKAIFFEHLDKHITDQELLEALEKDMRFEKDYLKLKEVLRTICSLKDNDDKACALTYLQSLNTSSGGGRLANKRSQETGSHLAHYSDWSTDRSNLFFDEMDAEWGYFSDSPVTEGKDKLQALFTDLAIACRSIIVLFEQNNTSKDTMAYDYAYKLMALLIESNDLKLGLPDLFNKIALEAYRLISSHGKRNKPFHDVLLVKLELPKADKIGDRIGWQKLIKQEGVKVFPFLAMAEKIEKKIKEKTSSEVLRAPATWKEANEMAILCKYTHAHKDRFFAALCYKYKVSEKCFNKSLRYMADGWPKKQGDSLPNLSIQGQGEAEGYFWVKLPITDKRCLILGHITDCCQSIDGDSEQCVKDGANLSNNGFYVLLKQRKKGAFTPVKDGEINDRDFDLIGQSYAWKSITGNLCLDSIECLRDSIPDSALKKILTDFATTVLFTDLSINRVTVGQGGGTPEGLFQRIWMHEKMLQGEQYDDSKYQYCIAKNQKLTEEQQDEWHKLLPDHLKAYQDILEYLSEHVFTPPDFVEQLKSILKTNPLWKPNISISLFRLFEWNKQPLLSDFTTLDSFPLTMDPAEVQRNVSLTCLVWNAGLSSYDMLKVLPYIPPEQLYEVFKFHQERGANYSKNTILKVFQTIPSKDRMQLIMQKDKLGKRLLELPPGDFKLCCSILNELSSELQLQVLSISVGFPREKWIYTFYLKDILTLLSMLEPNHRFEAAKIKDNKGNTLVHKFAPAYTELKKLLAFYSESQCQELLNSENDYGEIPLFFAVSSIESLKYLLSFYQPETKIALHGKKNNLTDATILHKAVNWPESLTALLDIYSDDKARRQALDAKTKSGCTVLKSAYKVKSLEIISKYYSSAEVLKAIKEKDSQGNSQLHNVCNVVNKRACLMLLNFYPDEERLAAIQEKNNAGETLLHCAAHKGKAGVLACLLEFYPIEERWDALCEKNQQGYCVFDLTSQLWSWLEILHALPESKRFDAIFRKSVKKNGCFDFIVAFKDQIEILKTLPSHMRLNAILKQNNAGNTLLFSASASGEEEVTTLLQLIPENLRWQVLQPLQANNFFIKTDALIAILNTLPKATLLSNLTEKDALGACFIEHLINSRVDLKKILNILTPDEQLKVVQYYLDFVNPIETPQLHELKTILLGLIKKQEEKSSDVTCSAFNEMKKQLQDCFFSYTKDDFLSLLKIKIQEFAHLIKVQEITQEKKITPHNLPHSKSRDSFFNTESRLSDSETPEPESKPKC